MVESWRTARLILVALALTGPVLLIDEAEAYVTDTHPFMVDCALEVLWDDGWEYLVDYLVESGSLGKIKSGVTDCDRLDLALNHYYNPVTEEGLAGATPATVVAQTFFDEAVDLYDGGDPAAAWYYLGWSLHCVQDLFVPFHSNLDPLNGHSEYEAYAHEYRHYLPLPANGSYSVALNASGWVVNASERSYGYYDGVSGENAINANFDAALTVLFPQTIAFTAGYIKFFADVAGVGEFNLYTLKRGIDFVKVGWDESVNEGFQSYEVWVALDEDDIFDGDPYAVIDERTVTWKMLTNLDLGVDYHVQVRCLSTNNVAESNMIEVSPAWPLLFLMIPAVTGLACILLLMSKKHKRPGKARR